MRKIIKRLNLRFGHECTTARLGGAEWFVEKIDKSLIDDIENNKKRRDFAHAVINMGQLMSCEVISEGVENDSQVNYLKEYGCNMIQGFVWGKPLMYEDAKKLIEN